MRSSLFSCAPIATARKTPARRLSNSRRLSGSIIAALKHNCDVYSEVHSRAIRPAHLIAPKNPRRSSIKRRSSWLVRRKFPSVASRPRPLEDVKPNPSNARTHSKRQIKLIADGVQTFGFVNPILINKSGMTIAGHGKIIAAKRLCMTEVPALRIEHLSQDEKRAYVWRTTSSPRWQAGTTTSSRSNCNT